MVEIVDDALPGFDAQRFRRHHGIDAEQRNAAQNERRNRGRQIHALREAASGHRAAILGLRQHIRQRVAADGIYAARPALLAERLAWFGKLGAIDDFCRAQLLQVVGFRCAAGGGNDVVAKLGKNSDRHRTHAARRTRLSSRTAEEIAAVNFGLNVEKQAQPASIIGAEEINAFVATLGMQDIPPSDRPKVRTDTGTRPVFAAIKGHDTVDTLPPRAENVAETTWSDWVFALDALFQANARDGAGGEINIEQNLALGRILGALTGRG